MVFYKNHTFLPKNLKKFWKFQKTLYLCNPKRKQYAEIAQLVEHNLAKVGVASSSLVFRSKTPKTFRNPESLFSYVVV